MEDRTYNTGLGFLDSPYLGLKKCFQIQSLRAILQTAYPIGNVQIRVESDLR